MPLVYLPESEALFLWGDEPNTLGAGKQRSAELITPKGLREVEGLELPLFQTMSTLAVIPAAAIENLPSSVAIWAMASKLAMELAARERMIPTIKRIDGRLEARWAAALSASEDATRVAALARAMPPSSYAVPAPNGKSLEVWAPEALLRAYLDAVVDALVRSTRGGPELPPSSSWDQRWSAALQGPARVFEPRGFAERSLVDELDRWSEPAVGARARLRACFRLELPEHTNAPFVLRFLLQSPDDPSLLVPAAEVWLSSGGKLEKLGRAFRDPQESLLEALGRASRLFAPIEQALTNAKPESIELDPATVWTFLAEGAVVLAEAGFGVMVPGELTPGGQRRLRLRMRVGGNSKTAGVVAGSAGLGLEELLSVNWDAVIGDQPLTAKELTTLAAQKTPLVRFRGAWVAIDPRELSDIQARLAAGPMRMTMGAAVQAALAGETREGQLSVAVTATGTFAETLERLKQSATHDLSAPATLQATLRPYQERGLNWLATMSSLGLGACLADDMGLGKTMQLLAFLLRRVEEAKADGRPALLVAPTSVVGNWVREAQRFAPSLHLTQHYGAERAREVKDFKKKPGTLVITSYGLLRRDAALLSAVDWSVVALDEAQNIKNAASTTASVARALKASHRFALTGTPVENRLAELWSILEFANPGMLGQQATFRREFALPIERYGDDAAATRLRRIVSPFILRRLKSDPTVIQDLPAKNEMKVICTLTREQATLYKAVVDEELRSIDSSQGIARRGRVLALLTFTKQICNHPAQFLSESGPLPKRSGKLSRITEMLEEALAAGDKALVFTQYREMGERLLTHFESLGSEVAFLHGGTPKKMRDELVRRFQEEPKGPRIFVLSVKAGGTGLNLTAANHVFHYDRWWNPAVEDQATDRAYRIGQKRAVQVHKLVCAGTVEEKIDRMLEQKRSLAAKVVGTGEQWITELGSSELKELFALSEGAVVGGEDDEPAPTRKRSPRSVREGARS